jgi:hypothetical protein
MIEDVASSAEIVATNAGHANRPEAINQDARLALFVVKADPSIHELAIAFEHIGADAGARSGRAQEKNPTETNRQLELRTARFDGGTASGKYVQRAIEEDGVQWVFGRPLCRHFGKRHSPCGNTVAD